MSRVSPSKISQPRRVAGSEFGSINSIYRKIFFPLILLIVLSILNITIKSEKINSQVWSLAIEIKVTSVTLLLVFVLLLPVLLPWILSLFSKLQGSLNWLREQGVEEVETSVLKIKLRYGLEAASKNYEDKIWTTKSTDLSSQETSIQIETRYREAIALIDADSSVDPAEALKQVDKLGEYYDQVREKMPSGSNRTRLMTEISSTIWTLVPKTIDFPVHARLSSPKGGERLSAYKYIEWRPSVDDVNLLLSRAIGILEVPFGQYSALLALRRVAITGEINSNQSREIIEVLDWSSKFEYIGADRRRLMTAIISLLK